MNHGINITLVIFGIMGLAFGPVGLIILVIAYLSFRANRQHVADRKAALYRKAIERDRRERIIAWKSFG